MLLLLRQNNPNPDLSMPKGMQTEMLGHPSPLVQPQPIDHRDFGLVGCRIPAPGTQESPELAQICSACACTSARM
jgi:hypothetical protein